MITIHSYTSIEPMLQVNAFIVESDRQLVIVDTTLTMSDSKALKNLADRLKKPVAGILLTHGHPDHVAGTYNITRDGKIPIYSTPGVRSLMEATEQAKHKQWSAMFGEEWIPAWVYPNCLVNDREVVDIGDISFQVLDLGSGGDCDANSIWLLNDEIKVAFAGDFLFNNNHSYMADGSILRWLANLERFSPLLRDYPAYYIGHGGACNYAAIEKQKAYFIDYCATLLDVTNGTGEINDDSRKMLQDQMIARYPSYGCQFMIGLSADKVGKELMSHIH